MNSSDIRVRRFFPICSILFAAKSVVGKLKVFLVLLDDKYFEKSYWISVVTTRFVINYAPIWNIVTVNIIMNLSFFLFTEKTSLRRYYVRYDDILLSLLFTSRYKIWHYIELRNSTLRFDFNESRTRNVFFDRKSFMLSRVGHRYDFLLSLIPRDTLGHGRLITTRRRSFYTIRCDFRSWTKDRPSNNTW